MHNHPKNGYSSATDFNTLYENPKIKYGIIVGHKGTIYKYTAPQKRIVDFDVTVAIKHYLHLDHPLAASKEMAYKDLGYKFGFTLEVIRNGKT